MKTLTNIKFNELINGQLRSDFIFCNNYGQLSPQGTIIFLDGYNIEGNSDGKVEFNRMPQPIELRFTNCRFPSVTILEQINSLTFIHCEVNEIVFERNAVNLDISGALTKINLIKIKQGLVYNFLLDASIGTIQLNGADNVATLTTELNGSIERLELNSFKSLHFNCSALIKECVVTNSYFFLRNPVTIQSLVLKEINNTYVELEGLFETVYIDSFRGDIILKNFTCLGDMTIFDQNVDPQVDRFIEIRNLYIGGKLTITKCDATFFSRLDNDINKYCVINELEFNQNLKGLEFKTLIWELAIYVNKLTFNDIHLPQDTFWMIQGLLCHDLIFNYFRNAGFGNISTTYGARFVPIKNAFDEVLKIYNESEKLNDQFFADNFIEYDLSNTGGSIVFNYSDIGKVNFIDDDFSDFTLFFNSTKLSEIYLAGSRLPRIVKASNLGGLPENLSHQERIANSQLKKLHEQHGDMLAANEYFSNEMNAYYQSLNWRSHFWEKLPLAFNKYSSNHGQSWIRALVCTLLVSSLFYAIFINCLGYHLGNPFFLSSWKKFILIASLYLDFLNPLHKLETFESLYNNHGLDPELRLIDGIGRIFVAYCVYQLIQAFRKHGRNK